MKKISVGIADDQFLFRQGLLALLNENEGLDIIIEASNGKELLEKLRPRQPDVVLLDLEMPEMDGAQATYIIRQRYPDMKIIVLTMHNDEALIINLIERGVNGFLTKDSDIEIVVDAIFCVVENDFFFNESISKAMVKKLVHTKKINPLIKYTALTDRELEVINLICKEYTNKEIAEELSLSIRTVEAHRESIIKKTKAKNTAGIVMYAVKHGLVGP